MQAHCSLRVVRCDALTSTRGTTVLIPRGTKLFWPDGSHAGEVVAPMPIDVSRSREGDRECTRITTRWEQRQPIEWLELCFDPHAVVESSQTQVPLLPGLQ